MMMQVLLPDAAEDDHVILVGSTAVLTPLQDPVHQSQEGCGCSTEAKGHHSKLEVADRCLESSVGPTQRSQGQLPVALAEV